MAVTVDVILGDHDDARDGIRETSLNEQTFAELYARWFPHLVTYCRRIGCGDDDPEDVAQEAFMKAWASRHAYLTGQPFWPWLSTIAQRACVDRWRRVARNSTRLDSLVGFRDVPTAQPDELVEEAAERELVSRAFGQLRPGERRVMGLRAIDGLTYSDIARSEDVTVESVRATLHRSRGALRLAYQRATETRPAAALLLSSKVLWARCNLLLARMRHAAVDATALERGSLAVLGAATLAVVALVVPAGPHGGPAGPAAPGASTTSTLVRPATSVPAEPAGAADAHHTATTVGPTSPGASANGGSGGPVDPSGRLPIDPAQDPEDAYFTQFASANDGSPHGVIFASGSAQGGCAQPTCPALFRSTDGGASWQRLPGVGFPGENILLPPSYPTDRRIFATTAATLHVSNDDGKTFDGLAPAGGPAAMSPAFNSGDPRILMGGAPGWVYRDDLRVASPLNTGTVVMTARSFAFSPSYPADPRMLMTGTEPTEDSTEQSVVTVCRLSACEQSTPLPGATGASRVRVAPSFARNGLAFAWRSDQLFRSADGGTTFEALRPPRTGAAITDLVFASDDVVYASALGFDAASRPFGGVFVSRDRGETWTDLTAGTSLARGMATVLMMPGGRLVAAGNGIDRGVQCSADGGRTWATRCPAVTS